MYSGNVRLNDGLNSLQRACLEDTLSIRCRVRLCCLINAAGWVDTPSGTLGILIKRAPR